MKKGERAKKTLGGNFPIGDLEGRADGIVEFVPGEMVGASYPYLWIGTLGGECIGTLEWKQLLRIAALVRQYERKARR